MPNPSQRLPPMPDMARYVAERLRAIASWTPTLHTDQLDDLERGDLHTFYSAISEVQDGQPGLLQRLHIDYQRLRAAEWLDAHGEVMSWAAYTELAEPLGLTGAGLGPLFEPDAVRPAPSPELLQLVWRKHRVVTLPLLRDPLRLSAALPDWVRRALPELQARPRHARGGDVWSSGSATLPVLSNHAAMAMDRATRGPDRWTVGESGIQYRDAAHLGVSLEYFKPDLDAAQLAELHHQLDVRTSDVWRLLLAKALESGLGQVYAPITIDMRELAKAMGYKAHHKGGMRPEHLQAVSAALEHLECFWITLTEPAEPKKAGRAGGAPVTHERKDRVLAIMGKDLERPLLGQPTALRWRVALGEWVQHFPRSYAHIFRNLVELPAKDGANAWAKQIGTELAYLYRQDRTPDPEHPTRRRRVKAITVRRLLERASLLDEVEKMRGRNHHKRAIERFEQVLDMLRGFGVHEGWAFDEKSVELLAQAERKPGSFDAWLAAVVLVQAPALLIDALPEPAGTPHKVAKSKKLAAPTHD